MTRIATLALIAMTAGTTAFAGDIASRDFPMPLMGVEATTGASVSVNAGDVFGARDLALMGLSATDAITATKFEGSAIPAPMNER